MQTQNKTSKKINRHTVHMSHRSVERSIGRVAEMMRRRPRDAEMRTRSSSSLKRRWEMTTSAWRNAVRRLPRSS